jgi:hypothetical protein
MRTWTFTLRAVIITASAILTIGAPLRTLAAPLFQLWRPGSSSHQRVQPGHRYAGAPMTRAQVARASLAEREAALRRLGRQHAREEGVAIKSDLRVMTSGRIGRDPTRPTYGKLARWVASRLQQQGVLPAGDGARGLPRYLQGFAWDERYTRARARSVNVVGIRRGDGSTNEAVLVIAHLDGLSAAEKRDYEAKQRSMSGYQGANDNASAVAAALYISDALGRLERQSGRALRRDVVFLFPSAEEEGLKGTEAFAKLSRQFGDKKFVGVVNFEMVGRGDPTQVRLFGGATQQQTDGNPLYTRAMAMPTKGRMARVTAGLPRDGGQGWFTRSDHYVTALGGIPSVMYLGDTGDYHTPSDNLAGIDVKTNVAVARHALRLVVGLANDPSAGRPGRALPFTVSTGYSGAVYPAAR